MKIVTRRIDFHGAFRPHARSKRHQEVHRSLFPILRVLADRRGDSTRVIDAEKALRTHPKVGASGEGFVIEQVLATEPHDEVWFWATHQGAEIDLILRRGDRLFGIECKRADSPKLTPSIRIAQDDHGLRRIAVIYPGAKRFAIAADVEAVPLRSLSRPGRIFGA